MKSFIHLNVVSSYSFKYGTTPPDALVARSVEDEAPALALTDRDGLAGAIRFIQATVRAGIAPIIGINCEYRSEKYQSKGRVILLARSEGGWRSLCRLSTALHTCDSEVSESGLLIRTATPHLTDHFLERFSEYTKNLTLIHTPLSPLAQAIAARQSESALALFNHGRDLFGDQVIETVSHLAPGSGPFTTRHAAQLLGFARDHDLPAILTNSVRMLDRSDAPISDVLDSARKLRPLDKRHIERRNSEAFLKSRDEMVALADEISRSAGERNGRALLKSTHELAMRSILSPKRDCGLGGIYLPEPEVVGANSTEEMRALLQKRSEAGLHWRYSSSKKLATARSRLADELTTVATLGYESYFLTVADIADMARERGIRVAARGSGAGSLICHLLGISGVDPLEHGLLMERFCSSLRRELPDIDIDVESARRLEIYNLVFNRYGDRAWSRPGNTSRCATVAMVDTYRARHAIRDAGAALGLPAGEIDLLAKAMPHIRARNISQALAHLPELSRLNISQPLVAMTIALAEKLDGLPRHLAMHPCAVVLSDGALLDRVPLQVNTAGYPMVEFDKDDVEAVGLLKLDILGVRMQSAIAYTVAEIARSESKAIDIDRVPLNDLPTFDLIQSARTIGIFQIESPGQRELVGKLAPKSFEDLIIDISLFRPGPVQSDMITPFLRARHGWASAQTIHSDLYEILAPTEGVVVFHEQVIQIISIMSGASLALADEKRRALGNLHGQQEVCDWFYSSCLSRGYERAVIDKVWEVLRAFAAFGFCKAHAAAFALPTYQSAWLKRHYPAAFLAGVLTHDPGMYPKRVIIDEAKQWGISIAPLDINLSSDTYRVERCDPDTAPTPVALINTASTGKALSLPDARGYAIRLALNDLNGISDSEVAEIIAGQPYEDLIDFLHRSNVSEPITERLILVGAFDRIHSLGGDKSEINRRDLLLHLQDFYRSGSGLRKRNRAGSAQLGLGFAPPPLSSSGLPDLQTDEKVRHEVEQLGMEISHHRIEFYAPFLNAIGAVRSADLLTQRSGSSILVAGARVALQTPPVRSGNRVVFLTIDDGYGCSDITFFADAQEQCSGVLFSSSLFLIRGIVRRTGARGISLRATGAWDLADVYGKWRAHQSTLVS